MRYSKTKQQLKEEKLLRIARGEVYARVRVKAGFTKQVDAIRQLGFRTPYQLSVYETGKADPPINVLIKMAETYRVSLDELLGYARSNHSVMMPLTPEDIQKLVIKTINKHYSKDKKK